MMLITFEREGGVLGIPLTHKIDTAKLPHNEACTLQSLINATQFFQVPERLNSHGAYCDGYHYRLTVVDGIRKHTVHVDENMIPRRLAGLIYMLERAACAERQKKVAAQAEPKQPRAATVENALEKETEVM